MRFKANKLQKPSRTSQYYPRVVMEERKRLNPIMLKARKDNKEAFFKVDKLIITKKLEKQYVPRRLAAVN